MHVDVILDLLLGGALQTAQLAAVTVVLGRGAAGPETGVTGQKSV